MTLATARIEVVLPTVGRLVGPCRLQVRLEDVSFQDGPAIVLTTVDVAVGQLDLRSAAQVIELALPFEIMPDRDVALTAVLAADPAAPRMPGDLLVTAHVAVVLDGTARVEMVEYTH